MSADRKPLPNETFVVPDCDDERLPRAYFEIDGAVAKVRELVSPEDPPGGPLSNRSASMLLDGIRAAREGRVVPLNMALLDLCDDDE